MPRSIENKLLSNSFPQNACPGFFHMPKAKDGPLCRVKIPQGFIQDQQLYILAFCAKYYAQDCLELTTRANIQIRAVQPKTKQIFLNYLTKYHLAPFNEKGDNVRNIAISDSAGFDAYAFINPIKLAQTLDKILQTTSRYQNLSPKFSILINGGEKTENIYHRNDIWLAALNDKQHYVLGIASCPKLMHKNEYTKKEKDFIIGIIPKHHALSTILKLIDIFLCFQKKYPSFKRPLDILDKSKFLRIFSYLLKKNLPHILPFTPNLKTQRFFAKDSHFFHPQKQKNFYYISLKPPLGSVNFLQIKMFLNFLKEIRTANHEVLLRLGPYKNFLIYNCHLAQIYKIAHMAQKWQWGCFPNDPYNRITGCSGLPFCHRAHRNSKNDIQKLAIFLTNDAKHIVHLSACEKKCAAQNEYDYLFVAQQDKNYKLDNQDPLKKNNPYAKSLLRILNEAKEINV